MCEYIDGVIYITRGDRGEIPVILKERDGSIHEMASGDRLILSVRDKTGHDGTLRLRCESSVPKIVISGDDTKSIPVGQYSADIQYNQAEYPGDPITVWPNYAGEKRKIKEETNWQNFWIMPEVTE